MQQSSSTPAGYDPREAEKTWWESGATAAGRAGRYPAGHYFAHSVVRSRIYDTLLSLGCNSGSGILDLGCGDGEDAVFVGKASHNIIGVDLSATALKQFATNGFQGLMADVRNLPFPDNSFDFTVCFGLLHHLVGQGGLGTYLEEFARVTKSRGYVLAMEPNVFNHSGLLMNIFNTLKPGITGLVPHERALSPLKLRGTFSAAGLKSVEYAAASFVWNRFPLPISKFIARHENGIRTRAPFKLFGWFEIIYGQKA
jgi:ubiquinone/menaquinone biosynthesis C-methylase UbiE